MQIAAVKNEYELDNALELVFTIFPELKIGHKYSRAFWQNRLMEQSELLLYASAENVVIGAAFAWVDNGEVTLAICCVAETHRGKGVGTHLMVEAENIVKKLGYGSITLGSREGAEEFYKNLGYTGSLLIQSEIHSVDQLKSINTEYEVVYINVYEKTVSQVCLRVPDMDKTLQRKYEETLPGCHTLMIFRKTL